METYENSYDLPHCYFPDNEERCFSINKGILRCNLRNKSLVAKCIVTDVVRAVMGVDSHEAYQINITSKMMSS